MSQAMNLSANNTSTNSCETFVDATANENGKVSREILIVLQFIIVVVATIGLFGNVLTMLAIVKYKKLQTMGNIFIFNLSVTDSLYFAIILPMRFVILQNPNRDWSHGFCTFLATTGHWFFGTSMTCLAAIAANRLVQVVFTHHYRTIYSKRCMPLHIFSTWLGAAIFAILLPVARIFGDFSYQKEKYSCTFTPGVDQHYRSFLSGLGLCVPSVFIVFCYTYIFVFVRAQKKRLQAWDAAAGPVVKRGNQVAPGSTQETSAYPQTLKPSTLTVTVEHQTLSMVSTSFSTREGLNGFREKSPPRIRTKHAESQRREALRMTLMMVCIFLVLLVCICPYFVIHLLGDEHTGPVAYLLSLSLTWLNGCANPVVYALRNAQFRSAYLKLLSRRL